MISIRKITCAIAALALSTGLVYAESGGTQQDTRAMEVLAEMSAFTGALDKVVINAVAFSDARLDQGLMVANSTEIEVVMNRPGSMLINSFDGVATKGLYFHEEMLTVFNSETMYYAQADIPGDIDDGMAFALENLGVEAPLMDLLSRKTSTNLITPEVTVLYLTDNSRVGGVDCHHIALRGPDSDVQIWIEEGDRPVPRKLMITSKWEGGSPRFWANLQWDTERKIDTKVFEFKAPESATKIEFVVDSSQP